MTKSIKLGILILSVVLMAVLIATTSLTFAKWTAGGGGEGGTTTSYGPIADSTNWNVYDKYFDYEQLSGGWAITGFSGVNLEDMIIPATHNGAPVISIKKLFNDTTRKLPVTVKIPYSVASISPSVFANCENLQKVIFGSYPTPGATATVCECGEYLFAGCTSLKEVYVYGNNKVNFGDYDFMGCTNLTSAPTFASVYIAFRADSTDETYYIAGSASNITYSANAKSGASFS